MDVVSNMDLLNRILNGDVLKDLFHVSDPANVHSSRTLCFVLRGHLSLQT